uniref:Small ribosomal subunit protein uS17c n=1 Tax=Apophlaea sinclairii TaxID=212746 RepID=A0A1C9CBV0_9FLOR|nr:ribosomal protein S17 [Apophlaea sinclairii]AOM65870.1 ribosomal protein S17 [Apophlaea sinclairii]
MALKEKTGIVISNKMNKTIVVAVKKQNFHTKYRKNILLTKKYKAHDERNQYTVGDIVTIKEVKPISKTKRWTVINISL